MELKHLPEMMYLWLLFAKLKTILNKIPRATHTHTSARDDKSEDDSSSPLFLRAIVRVWFTRVCVCV